MAISRHLLTPIDLPEDTISMTHRLRRPPTPQSLHNGLGPCGSALVPFEVWRDLGAPSVLPPHPPAAVPPSADAQSVLRSLARDGIMFPSYPQNAAPCFVTYKSETKPRVILDFHCYNLQYNTMHACMPTHFFCKNRRCELMIPAPGRG